MRRLLYFTVSVVISAATLTPAPAVSGYIETTICISSDPNNNGCPINANPLGCFTDPGNLAHTLCALVKPDGTKVPLPYVITEGPHGASGSCGWKMMHLTCIAP
jgi:hypothetical protein